MQIGRQKNDDEVKVKRLLGEATTVTLSISLLILSRCWHKLCFQKEASGISFNN